MRATARPLHQALVSDGQIAPMLYVLMGAVGFLLLIACVNVANLFLSRAATRRREIALRAALGASPRRIFSQLIAESLVFALLSTILGVAIAVAGTRILSSISPPSLPPVGTFEFDWRVLGFTLALSLVVAFVTGTAAALYALRADVNESIKSGGQQQAIGFGRAVPRVLIAVEVALSLVLLAGAALLAGTVVRLYRVPLGFDAANLTSASISLASDHYSKSASVADFQRRAIEALSAVPGVVSVAGASSTPLERGLNTVVFPKGTMSNDGSDMVNIEFRAVSPQYFRTIGIPLTIGRDFSDADAAGAAPVMIVNQALAKLIWPKDSAAPVGKPLLVGEGGPKTPARTVVGVVADIREAGVNRPVRATVYVPQAQLSDEFTQMTNYWFASSLLVRTSPGFDITSELRRVVAAVDPELPVARAASMRQVLDDSIGVSRFLMLLMAGFAGLALVLACVGIYAVLSFQISRRTREIGIRVALGASRREVLRLVLGEGTRPAFAGIAAGLAAAFVLSRLLEGMLFGVSAHDPLVYAAVAAALASVAALASWIPARRALRVDPIVALRDN
jgi:predicted permease